MNGSKIGLVSAVLMVGVAVIFDVLQFVFTLSVLFIPVAWFVSALAWIVFFVWFALKGVNYFGNGGARKAVTAFAGVIIEMVPIIDALPGLTLSVLALIIMHNADIAKEQLAPDPRATLKTRQEAMKAYARARRREASAATRQEQDISLDSQPRQRTQSTGRTVGMSLSNKGQRRRDLSIDTQNGQHTEPRAKNNVSTPMEIQSAYPPASTISRGGEVLTGEQAVEENTSAVLDEESASETSGEVTSSRSEARDFSKEYSAPFRSKLAVELVAMRKKYRVELPQENVERAGKREQATKDFAEQKAKEEAPVAKARQALQGIAGEYEAWKAQSDELELAQGTLNKAKSNIFTRLTKGSSLRTQELDLRQRKNELGSFDTGRIDWAKQGVEREELYASILVKGTQRELDYSLSKLQNVIIDDGWVQLGRAKLRAFYETQNDTRQEYELSGAERSIGENTLKHNALFLHGISFGQGVANTHLNNASLDTTQMSPEDKARFLLGLAPTISASSKTLDPALAVNMPQEMMYKTGLVLGGGEIMSAYSGDAGTYADSLTSKYGKYDEEAESTVQRDIATKVAGAATATDRKGLPWNEFVVSNPKISALYIYQDSADERLETDLKPGTYKRLLSMAEELGVPIVRIDKSGKMQNLLENKREISAKELIAGVVDYTPEERTRFVETGYADAFGRAEDTGVEVKERLATLTREMPEISVSTLERRRGNTNLARAERELLTQRAA